MLTDEEAKEIERQYQHGVRGPILLTWLARLLADRRERVQQLHYLQHRLRQAFRYLDGLFVLPKPDAAADARGQRTTRARPLACPICRKPYVRASGISPNGVGYTHADGRECRSGSSGNRAAVPRGD